MRAAVLLLLTACATAPATQKAPEPAAPAPTLQRIGPVEKLPPFIERWALRSSAGASPVDVFLSRDDEKRPLVVLLQGSGCEPLLQFAPNGRGLRSSLFFFSLMMEQPRRAHFAAVEKRGVQSLSTNAPGNECSARYQEEGISKQARVADAVAVIRELAKAPWVDGVYVVGHSEGAQVAAGVAGVLDRELRAVALLAGASGGQFHDFVAQARRANDAPGLELLFKDVALFSQGPLPGGAWKGHPELRWRSFAWTSTPLDDLRQSTVPVFVGHGELDTSSSVESADLFVVELVRERGSWPLRYEVYPGHSHTFAPEGGPPRAKQIFDRFFAWATAEPTGISVEHVALDADSP